MDLTGFVAFDFSKGIPYLSATSNGVTFSKEAVTRIGSPSYVRVLINEKAKQVALQACKTSDPGSTRFCRNKGKISMIRMTSHGLLKAFKDLMKSDLKCGFRVEGELVEPGLMIFDLANSKPISNRKR